MNIQRTIRIGKIAIFAFAALVAALALGDIVVGWFN